ILAGHDPGVRGGATGVNDDGRGSLKERRPGRVGERRDKHLARSQLSELHAIANDPHRALRQARAAWHPGHEGAARLLWRRQKSWIEEWCLTQLVKSLLATSDQPPKLIHPTGGRWPRLPDPFQLLQL